MLPGRDAKFLFSYHSNTSCSQTFTMPVRSYAPNAFGLYDMHGNVWELCLDVFAPYTPGPATDPFVGGGSNRVVRGGGWDSNSNALRSAHRVSANIGAMGFNLGFRVVLGPILVP
ncbi:MAG: formylglycine-generating enzyme family protein [Deltaproteobacteria bacterium]|nr:formylglycine-generating enzyme family protein [Deltaproteobacteria bacterium]